MTQKNKSSIDVWVAVNKNGDVLMFTDEPTRNNDTGKWESANPYINSLIQKDFDTLMKKSNVTWEAEPNMFTLSVQ